MAVGNGPQISAQLSSLSAVVPMYNELPYVRRTADALRQVLASITDDFEIIFVNDASTDGSGELAEEVAKEMPQLVVVHHAVNRKLGGSLKSGFGAARKDWVLYCDMDQPFELTEIRRAARLLNETRADAVVGWRTNREVAGVKRLVYSRVYNRFIKYAFGLDLRDVNFSFKLIRRELLEGLELQSEGSFIDAELMIKAWRRGAHIEQLGTEYLVRRIGRSKLSSPKVIANLLSEATKFRLGLMK